MAALQINICMIIVSMTGIIARKPKYLVNQGVYAIEISYACSSNRKEIGYCLFYCKSLVLNTCEKSIGMVKHVRKWIMRREHTYI